MSDKPYNRSYKGIFLWIIFLFAANSSAVTLSDLIPEEYSVYLTMSTTIICIDFLLYIIYKTERIYWINGVSYDEAKKASSEERKVYAQRHLAAFFNATLLWFLYGIVKYLFSPPLWWDIAVSMVIIIGAAISTIKIKLHV